MFSGFTHYTTVTTHKRKIKFRVRKSGYDTFIVKNRSRDFSISVHFKHLLDSQ